MKPDELYMQRCIDIAGGALGLTAPNPLVGAVIVYKNKIVAEGFHKIFGGLHAEADAIEKIRDKDLLKKSTLFVNLEPCSHKGKTPPCAELIINSGITRVFIGNPDPNMLVSGKGIRFLRKNGVKVKTGICENSCIELNKRFFTYHVLKRPYIILKWAQSIDGFIDIIRTPGHNTGINWISNETSRLLVHKWRSEEQAIMVGTNTVRMDNPKLNTRHWNGQNPIRIITDRNLNLPHHLHIFDNSLPTIIYNTRKTGNTDNIDYVKVNFEEKFIDMLLNDLFKRGIQSIIIEGGKKLLESFIQHNMWDEGRIFIGEKKFGQGLAAPSLENFASHKSFIQKDQLLIYRNYNPFFQLIKDGIHSINNQ